MAIEIYPVQIEAYDSVTHDKEFTLEMHDDCCAFLTVKTIVAPGESLEELFRAIRDGLAMMKLKAGGVD